MLIKSVNFLLMKLGFDKQNKYIRINVLVLENFKIEAVILKINEL